MFYTGIVQLIFSACMLRGGCVCRNLLRTAIRKGGELDTAPRKAEVLNRICEQLRFDSDVAALLHRYQPYGSLLVNKVQ